MWGDRDDFHFVWKRMTGNFILSTRARFIGTGVDPHRKIGWTIRPALEANSPHVTAALHGDGLMSLQFRRTPGGMTEEAKSRDSLPNADAVIQLERRDGVYVMSVARFGDTLVTQDLTGVTLPDTVYVGLFVCAHNDTVVERAAFSNVRITIPPKPGLRCLSRLPWQQPRDSRRGDRECDDRASAIADRFRRRTGRPTGKR